MKINPQFHRLNGLKVSVISNQAAHQLSACIIIPIIPSIIDRATTDSHRFATHLSIFDNILTPAYHTTSPPGTAGSALPPQSAQRPARPPNLTDHLGIPRQGRRLVFRVVADEPPFSTGSGSPLDEHAVFHPHHEDAVALKLGALVIH